MPMFQPSKRDGVVVAGFDGSGDGQVLDLDTAVKDGLDHIKAHLEDGVLRITVPKFSDEAKRQSKVIDIDSSAGSGENVETTTTTRAAQ